MVQAKRLIPAIHVLNLEQAKRNCELAFAAGCDGVFLINHENEAGVRELFFNDLLDIHATLAEQFPNLWIGVNCLDLAAADLFQHLDSTVSGLWVDDAEIDERRSEQTAAEQILKAKADSNWQGEYFGGVAFKYQRQVQAPADAARIATNYMDVVTTSGSGTGTAAPVEKVKQMKLGVGNRPLAIASGITAENVDQFLPWVDVFIVATGISHSFYELDAKKVRQLADIIHTWRVG